MPQPYRTSLAHSQLNLQPAWGLPTAAAAILTEPTSAVNSSHWEWLQKNGCLRTAEKELTNAEACSEENISFLKCIFFFFFFKDCHVLPRPWAVYVCGGVSIYWWDMMQVMSRGWNHSLIPRLLYIIHDIYETVGSQQNCFVTALPVWTGSQWLGLCYIVCFFFFFFLVGGGGWMFFFSFSFLVPCFFFFSFFFKLAFLSFFYSSFFFFFNFSYF